MIEATASKGRNKATMGSVSKTCDEQNDGDRANKLFYDCFWNIKCRQIMGLSDAAICQEILSKS